MDKLTSMATLVAVADTGSFTGAADALDVPKSRISQRVTALEQELGVRLIQRTTRAIKFTEEGLGYLATCRAILQDIHDAEDAIKDAHVEPTGSLRIDALVSVARHVLAPRLHEFHKRYPQIKIKLTASDRFSHLLEEGVDCAIRGGVLDDSSAVAKQLQVVHLGLYASPHYLKEHAPITHPAQLRQHHLLSWFASTPKPFDWHLISHGQLCDVEGLPHIVFDDPDVAIQACLSGAGICPGAPFAVAHLVQQGLLIPVLAPWHFPPRPMSVVYPSRRHLTARTRVFIAWLTQVIDSTPSLCMLPADLAQLTPNKDALQTAQQPAA